VAAFGGHERDPDVVATAPRKTYASRQSCPSLAKRRGEDQALAGGIRELVELVRRTSLPHVAAARRPGVGSTDLAPRRRPGQRDRSVDRFGSGKNGELEAVRSSPPGEVDGPEVPAGGREPCTLRPRLPACHGEIRARRCRRTEQDASFVSSRMRLHLTEDGARRQLEERGGASQSVPLASRSLRQPPKEQPLLGGPPLRSPAVASDPPRQPRRSQPRPRQPKRGSVDLPADCPSFPPLPLGEEAEPASRADDDLWDARGAHPSVCIRPPAYPSPPRGPRSSIPPPSGPAAWVRPCSRASERRARERPAAPVALFPRRRTGARRRLRRERTGTDAVAVRLVSASGGRDLPLRACAAFAGPPFRRRVPVGDGGAAVASSSPTSRAGSGRAGESSRLSRGSSRRVRQQNVETAWLWSQHPSLTMPAARSAKSGPPAAAASVPAFPPSLARRMRSARDGTPPTAGTRRKRKRSGGAAPVARSRRRTTRETWRATQRRGAAEGARSGRARAAAPGRAFRGHAARADSHRPRPSPPARGESRPRARRRPRRLCRTPLAARRVTVGPLAPLGGLSSRAATGNRRSPLADGPSATAAAARPPARPPRQAGSGARRPRGRGRRRAEKKLERSEDRAGLSQARRRGSPPPAARRPSAGAAAAGRRLPRRGASGDAAAAAGAVFGGPGRRDRDLSLPVPPSLSLPLALCRSSVSLAFFAAFAAVRATVSRQG
jgi:hypothetical protein